MARNKKMYEILHSLEKDYGQHTWPHLVSESNPRLKQLRKVANAGNSGRKMVIDFEEVKRSITDGFPSMYNISKRLGISRTVIERTIKENHELSELYKKKNEAKNYGCFSEEWSCRNV